MAATSETWLSIGDLTLRLTANDSRLVAPVGASSAFVCPPRPADITIDASWGETLVEPAGTVLFESGASWRLIRTSGEFAFTCRSSLREPPTYVIARFDDDRFTRGMVTLDPRHFPDDTAPAFALDYPLDELVWVHNLARGRGVELHACGVRDAAGRVYVFAGQSGAGKSTTARLWAGRPGFTVLSDERLVVRTDGDLPLVYGTPWHGDAEIASPASGPLGGVFLLRQATAHAATLLPPPIAAAQLLSCAFLPFYDPRAVAHTVDAVERIVASTTVSVLSFAADPSIVDFVTTIATATAVETRPAHR
jgi:hypothetical protein